MPLTRADWLAASVAPPGSFSRTALRLLNVDVGTLEAAAATHLRAQISYALAGVRTRPTENYPEGISRGSLIRACGRQHALKIGEAFDLGPQCCRQRPCPSCARARARRNATDVQRAMERRAAAARSIFAFGTFTQPKRSARDENPREAVDRIVAVWRSIVNSRTAMGREFHRLFAGGLRTTETTYSVAGDEQHNGGGVVECTGYHAHLHVLLEVRAGIDRAEACGWLQRAWLQRCAGASAAAQHVRPANTEDAQQLCKYITKPLELVAHRPGIVQQLFGALHGVRLLQAFGEWMGRAGKRVGWRELAKDGDDVGPTLPVWRGPEIGEVLRWATAKYRPIGVTDTIDFKGRRPGDEVAVSAEHAWAMIEQTISDRVRSR